MALVAMAEAVKRGEVHSVETAIALEKERQECRTQLDAERRDHERQMEEERAAFARERAEHERELAERQRELEAEFEQQGKALAAELEQQRRELTREIDQQRRLLEREIEQQQRALAKQRKELEKEMAAEEREEHDEIELTALPPLEFSKPTFEIPLTVEPEVYARANGGGKNGDKSDGKSDGKGDGKSDKIGRSEDGEREEDVVAAAVPKLEFENKERSKKTRPVKYSVASKQPPRRNRAWVAPAVAIALGLVVAGSAVTIAKRHGTSTQPNLGYVRFTPPTVDSSAGNVTTSFGAGQPVVIQTQTVADSAAMADSLRAARAAQAAQVAPVERPIPRPDFVDTAAPDTTPRIVTDSIRRDSTRAAISRDTGAKTFRDTSLPTFVVPRIDSVKPDTTQ
jgi:hypothetical protein